MLDQLDQDAMCTLGMDKGDQAMRPRARNLVDELHTMVSQPIQSDLDIADLEASADEAPAV